MSKLVIYHANCMDGVAAAACAYKVFGDSAEYVPVQYGEEPPCVEGKEVYVLDFSFKRDILLRMWTEAKSLVVLDHHKTAAEDLEGLKFCIFNMSKSGAMLAWEYFNHGVPAPYDIQLVQDRDLWRFELPSSKAFNAGARALMSEMSPKAFIRLDIQKAIAAGELLLKVDSQQREQHFKHRHIVNILGHIGFACNAPAYHASELGNMLAKESGNFGVVYSYSGDDNQYHCSIRSIGDYDVSTIAKQFGGGGHKNAAGFAVKELPWL